MEQIDRRDVLNYLNHLKASGNVPRTVSQLLRLLEDLLHTQKIVWPLEKTDRVKYTEKVVSSYQPEEIAKLLGAADQEESGIQFFLFTGSRDQEVQYATWRDVDFRVSRLSMGSGKYLRQPLFAADFCDVIVSAIEPRNRYR